MLYLAWHGSLHNFIFACVDHVRMRIKRNAKEVMR